MDVDMDAVTDVDADGYDVTHTNISYIVAVAPDEEGQ